MIFMFMKMFFPVWAADRFFFLLLLVLSDFSASADVLRKITAYVGETVLLPCHIPLSEDDLPTVEWSKEGLSPNITFLYRDGCETFAEKHPLFCNRTSLVLNKLKDGDLSQIIHALRLSDAGVYHCMTRRRKQAKVEAILELVVAAVSEPKLTFVPGADNGVRLQCRAECWFPEPELVFLDDQGSEIKADAPHRNKESSGCFTITRNVTLQGASQTVTCRAQETQTNHSRDTHLYIPGSCVASCTLKIMTSLLIFAVLVLSGVALKYRNTGCQPLINIRRQRQDDIEKLKGQNEKLAFELSEEKARNWKLDAELNELRSKLRPAPPCDQHYNTSTSASNGSKQVNQPPRSDKPKPAVSSTSIHQEPDPKPKTKDSKSAGSRPKLVHSPQKKDSRSKGTPVFSTNGGSTPSSHPPALTPEESSLLRSQSFSFGSDHVKPVRRHTMPNRFSVLQNLPEDSESLLQYQ